jgi:hypothetical protein
MNRSGHKCCFFGISAKKESQLCQLGGWVFASHNYCRKVGGWSLRFRRFTEHGEIATSSAAKNSFNHSRLITGGHLKICCAKDLMLFHFFTFLFLKNITSSILHQYLLGMGWGTIEILHPMFNWDDGLFQLRIIMRAPALSRLVEDYARKSCRAFPLEDQHGPVVFTTTAGQVWCKTNRVKNSQMCYPMTLFRYL